MSKLEFCAECESILVLKKNKEDKVVNFCEVCKKSYEIKKKILRRKTKKTISQHKEMVEAAMYDDTMPRIEKNCKICSNDILVYFKDKETMKNVYVCRSCNNYWTNL